MSRKFGIAFLGIIALALIWVSLAAAQPLPCEREGAVVATNDAYITRVANAVSTAGNPRATEIIGQSQRTERQAHAALDAGDCTLALRYSNQARTLADQARGLLAGPTDPCEGVNTRLRDLNARYTRTQSLVDACGNRRLQNYFREGIDLLNQAIIAYSAGRCEGALVLIRQSNEHLTTVLDNIRVRPTDPRTPRGRDDKM